MYKPIFTDEDRRNMFYAAVMVGLLGTWTDARNRGSYMDRLLYAEWNWEMT